jgi:hypothetical protein
MIKMQIKTNLETLEQSNQCLNQIQINKTKH